MADSKTSKDRRVLIVGAGRVGSAIAWVLRKDVQVLLIDIDERQLQRVENRMPHVQCFVGTVEDCTFLKDQVDIIVQAVPGHVGLRSLEKIISWSVPVVDVSFMPEDPRALDELAKRRGIPIVVDCGIAPGWSNVVVGYWNRKMHIRSVRIYVGGLPQERTGPWEYYAVFSPADIIEEYLRPVRIRRDGVLLTVPPLSELERVELDFIDSSLEAFLTDGLRSLLFSLKHIPHMEEKTLRYPGYAEKIRLLQQSGFFDTDPLPECDGAISPLECTTAVLQKAWSDPRLERDMTLMRIHMEGTDFEGTEQIVQMDLVDYYDELHAMLSMSRCTGFTAAAVVHLLLNQKIKSRGVVFPEDIGARPALYHFIQSYLQNQGIRIQTQVQRA